MFKFRNLLFIFSISILMATGGTASAVCDQSDGNNTEATAAPIGLTETVSGVVCPEDPFDFYVMEIPDGATLCGQMTFSSPQESTVIRIYHSVTGARIVDDVFTSEATKQFVFTVNPGDVPSGTYYIRLFFWSNAAYDHEYTVVMDLNDGTSTPLLEINADLAWLLLDRSPWPNPSGTARNTNRANFQGPFGLITKAHSVKLSKLYTEPYVSMKYEGLVVGPDSEIIFADNDTNEFYRYKFPGRSYGPNFASLSSRPPCFDIRGKLYVIETGTYMGASLVCYNKFNSDEAWQRNLPLGSDYAVMAARELIYTKVGGSTHKLQVWDKDGNQVCELSFPSPVGGVAEDLGNEKFFVQTRKALHKFDFNGNQEWVYEGLTVVFSNSNDPWEAVGPIVAYDGSVWATSTFGGPWAVLTPDGSVYKSGGSIDFFSPIPESTRIAVALGSDGRFYVASSGQMFDSITCCEDWDQKVWSTDILDGKLNDMILDSQNRIYICFADWFSTGTHGHGWKCLDPANGNVIMTVMDIGEPAELVESRLGAELAIGSDRQLVMLLKGGYVAVFENIKFKPEHIEIGGITKMGFGPR